MYRTGSRRRSAADRDAIISFERGGQANKIRTRPWSYTYLVMTNHITERFREDARNLVTMKARLLPIAYWLYQHKKKGGNTRFLLKPGQSCFVSFWWQELVERRQFSAKIGAGKLPPRYLFLARENSKTTQWRNYSTSTQTVLATLAAYTDKYRHPACLCDSEASSIQLTT